MPLITTEYDPNICQCCGADATSDIRCVCTAYPEWYQNEHGDVACGYHKADMFIDPKRTTVAVGGPSLPHTLDRYRNLR
jgi:hypothetical protein